MLLKLIDFIFELFLPKPAFFDASNGMIQIIAHRGAHSIARGIKENTREAFFEAARIGCDGIELDVRWSRDHVPFVLHDSNPKRVFKGLDFEIQDLNAAQILLHPEIMPLQEVIEEFSQRLHLMIEIKTPLTQEQNQSLKLLLSSLKPAKNFHLLALEPEIFESITEFPSSCFLPVVEYRLSPWVNWLEKNPAGGITGHYARFLKHHIQKFKTLSLKIGTGMINSPQVLSREQSRGVCWAFTDQAHRLIEFQKTKSTRSE